LIKKEYGIVPKPLSTIDNKKGRPTNKNNAIKYTKLRVIFFVFLKRIPQYKTANIEKGRPIRLIYGKK
jgi:hypothetical protein